MSDTLVITLLAGLIVVLPVLLLFIYRKTIPPGVLWAALIGTMAVPVIGWCFGIYVALKEWD